MKAIGAFVKEKAFVKTLLTALVSKHKVIK